MASQLIALIVFRVDNPSGEFLAGDRVAVYYDVALDPGAGIPDTAGYTVLKNDVQIYSGAIFSNRPSNPDILTAPLNYKVCNGTTLIVPYAVNTFPYFRSSRFPDNPSCAIVPSTCDLIVIGQPAIKGSSALLVNDGEITIVAQSSNPIQYKFNSDFVYGDGTAQTDGHFYSNAGSYRIYIRDSKNCSTSVYVTVPVNNVYAPYYRLEYFDRIGAKTKIEILRRAYDGEVMEVVGGDSPIELSLRGEGENDKFIPILPTDADISFVSEVNYQFEDLFTNSQKEFRAVYYKDFGGMSPPFVPDAMADFLTWGQEGSGSQPSWAVMGSTQRVRFNATDSPSKGLYTLYDFAAGNDYKFDWEFRVEKLATIHKCIFYVKFTNEEGADLGVTLMVKFINTEFGGDDHLNKSGTFEFNAPQGADRIKIIANCDTKADLKVVAFDNVSEIHGGVPIGYELMWMGNVLPQQYQEEYKAPPYYVSITAKDSLNDLQNIDFIQDDGQPFFGRIRIIELIATCLKKTLLDLPIRCAVNLFADDMDDSHDYDDPFDQGYVDLDTYYLQGDLTSYMFVLQELLRPFRARLVQWGGYWNILRPEELIDAYAYRQFDKDGVYVTSGLYDPVKNVRSPSENESLKWVKFPYLELRPGYGTIQVEYNLGLRNNILRNGNFRLKSVYDPIGQEYSYSIDKFGFQLVAPYPISEGFEILESPNVAYTMSSQLDSTTGEAYLQSDVYKVAMGSNNQLKIKARFKLPIPVRYGLGTGDDGNLQVFLYQTLLHYQKVRMLVTYGNMYLLSDGSWTIFPSECAFYITDYGQYVDAEMVCNSPGNSFSSDTDFQIKVFHSYANHAEFHSIADLKARVTGVGNYRGGYDAGSNLFPAAGGSGPGGAPAAGDKWSISNPGILAGRAVLPGNSIIALVADPGEIASGWLISGALITALPVGTKTETGPILSSGSDGLGYWELEENTEDNQDDNFGIVRPNDYDAATNPVQWILKNAVGENGSQNPTVFFALDYLSVEFLVDGKSPIGALIRTQNGEPNNNLTLSETVYHGSLSSIVQSNLVLGIKVNNPRFDIFLNAGRPVTGRDLFPRVSTFFVTQNILSGKLIFAGFISDKDGDGFERWSRASVSESKLLHELFLITTGAQYSRSWKKITGQLNGDIHMGLIDLVRHENIVYLPTKLTIHDRNNQYEGEFLELVEPTVGGKGFTIGFSEGLNA